MERFNSHTAVLLRGKIPLSGLPCDPTFFVSSCTVPYLVNFGDEYFFLGLPFTVSIFSISRLRELGQANWTSRL